MWISNVLWHWALSRLHGEILVSDCSVIMSLYWRLLLLQLGLLRVSSLQLFRNLLIRWVDSPEVRCSTGYRLLPSSGTHIVSHVFHKFRCAHFVWRMANNELVIRQTCLVPNNLCMLTGSSSSCLASGDSCSSSLDCCGSLLCSSAGDCYDNSYDGYVYDQSTLQLPSV